MAAPSTFSHGGTVAALTGAGSPLGRRVLAALACRPGGVAEAVLLDPDAPDLVAELADDLPALVLRAAPGDPAVHEAALLDGVDVVVHLAGGPAPSPMGAALSEVARAGRLAGLRSLLRSAAEAGVRRVVLLSSAVVYGAWPDNPLPLSEDAPVRPDPAFGWAVEQAEAERLVGAWAADGEGREVTVLRPALVVAPEDEAFLVRALGGTRSVRAAGEPRPVQFVHVDDLASAVSRCTTGAFTGVFNVAPEGWITDADAAALAGNSLPRPALPARLVAPARRIGWRLGFGQTPPEAEAYATHPWVVAADRLRARGWQPGHSNEEAVVATTEASPLATLSPRRRQELLLAAVGVVVLLGAAAGAAAAVRHRRLAAGVGPFRPSRRG